MTADLSGTTVLLTGAAGRLGRVIARHLLRAGASVAALDADPSGLDASGDALRLYRADLTDEADVERAFREALDAQGPARALIHAVGAWDGRPLAETSLVAWRHQLDVNLTSTFLCFREAVRHFGARGGGRLVAFASKQGADGGATEQAAYSAAKAGVVRLVEATAREHGARGVTAAAIAPSTILFGGEGDAAGVPAERLAALAVYLASEAGAVHNGAVLRAYGSAG